MSEIYRSGAGALSSTEKTDAISSALPREVSVLRPSYGGRGPPRFLLASRVNIRPEAVRVPLDRPLLFLRCHARLLPIESCTPSHDAPYIGHHCRPTLRGVGLNNRSQVTRMRFRGPQRGCRPALPPVPTRLPAVATARQTWLDHRDHDLTDRRIIDTRYDTDHVLAANPATWSTCAPNPGSTSPARAAWEDQYRSAGGLSRSSSVPFPIPARLRRRPDDLRLVLRPGSAPRPESGRLYLTDTANTGDVVRRITHQGPEVTPLPWLHAEPLDNFRSIHQGSRPFLHSIQNGHPLVDELIEVLVHGQHGARPTC